MKNAQNGLQAILPVFQPITIDPMLKKGTILIKRAKRRQVGTNLYPLDWELYHAA